jgi:large subunit ribosomal protein L25
MSNSPKAAAKPQLTAEPLTATTKGEVKRLRQSGYVPVSIQHRGNETIHLQEEEKPLDAFIIRHGNSGVAELIVGPKHKKHTVVIHDIQRDPISKRLLHVTFQDMMKGDTVKTHIALVLKGEPEAVRTGDGVLSQALMQLEIRTDVSHMVDHITVDVSNMELGTSLRVADLPKQHGYEILTPEDTLIVSVTAPTAMDVEPVIEPTEEVPVA